MAMPQNFIKWDGAGDYEMPIKHGNPQSLTDDVPVYHCYAKADQATCYCSPSLLLLVFFAHPMADPVACWAFTCNDRLIKLRPEAVALSSEFTHAVNINSMELVVPDIDPEALPYVVEYMNHYAACHEGIPELPKPLGPDGLQSFPWEDHFVSAVREAQRLSEVMYAAHKLKVRGLMELSCAGVALQFLNSKCSLSATCLALGQVPDFTAEEQKQLATERQHYTSDPNGPRSRNEHMQGSLSFSVWMTHSEKDWESVDPRCDYV